MKKLNPLLQKIKTAMDKNDSVRRSVYTEARLVMRGVVVLAKRVCAERDDTHPPLHYYDLVFVGDDGAVADMESSLELACRHCKRRVRADEMNIIHGRLICDDCHCDSEDYTEDVNSTRFGVTPRG